MGRHPQLVRRYGLASVVALVATLGLFAAVAADDWPQFGHDANHSGNNGGDQFLTPSNAGSLGLRWTFQTGSAVAAAPAVANGTVYVGSWDGNMYALDAKTGALKWRAFLGITTGAPGCHPSQAGISSGAAVANGVVYVGGGDSYFYALNAQTGAALWRVFTGNNSPSSGHYNWASPSLVGNGLAFVGVSSFGDCPLVLGQLLEVDVNQQKVIATANVVDPGQLGGGIWTSPASLPTGGTVYVTTGSQYVNNGNQALAYAILALSWDGLAVTDSWQVPASEHLVDGDWGTSPVPFRTREGAWRIGAADKNGIYYAFDAHNLGQGPVWQTRIAAGGVNPTGGDGSIASAAWDGSHLLVAGGNTSVDGVGFPGAIRALDPDSGEPIWQIGTPQGTILGALATANGVVVDEPGATLEVRDAANGNVLFSSQTGGQIYSGAAIANGFIYTGSTDGKVYAYGLPPGNQTLVQCSTPTPLPPTPTPGPATLGNSAVGTTYDPGEQNQVEGSQVTAATNSTITAIKVYLYSLDSGSRALTAAIYTDQGGVPKQLVWSSREIGLEGPGWETIEVPDVGIDGGQKYWLLFEASGAGTQGVWSNVSNAAGWTAAEGFNAWPALAPSGTTSTHLYSIAATLAATYAPRALLRSAEVGSHLFLPSVSVARPLCG